MCQSTQLSCGPQLWPSTSQSSFHTHMIVTTPTASQMPETVNITAFATSSQGTRQSNGTPRLQLSHNIQLRLRVVGDQNANHVLIRVRHRSRTSPWVSISESSSPNHSRPRTWTCWPHPHLGTSLPLATSDQFRTEKTAPSHHDNPADRELNALFCVFPMTPQTHQ